MGNIHSVLEVQSSKFLQDNITDDNVFESSQRGNEPMKYLRIVYNLFYKKLSNILWSISTKQPNKSTTWHNIVMGVQWSI